MAELLIKLESAADSTNLNAWNRGHVVCVQEDGWGWGRLECPPKYCVIHISDMTIEEARVYLESETEIPKDKKTLPKMISIRKYKFDFDDVSFPKEKSDNLKIDGKVSVTKTQIKDCIKNIKVDGK
jgi:hypothetical protein